MPTVTGGCELSGRSMTSGKLEKGYLVGTGNCRLGRGPDKGHAQRLHELLYLPILAHAAVQHAEYERISHARTNAELVQIQQPAPNPVHISNPACKRCQPASVSLDCSTNSKALDPYPETPNPSE